MTPAQLTRDEGRTLKPALIVRLSPEDFRRLFAAAEPAELPDFSVPEPSLGGALRLRSGAAALYAWGKASHELDVDLSPATGVAEFLAEVGIPASALAWSREEPKQV